MTKSKRFKFLTNFAFFISAFALFISAFALGASAYAQPQTECGQTLNLQKNESANVTCPQGLSPVLHSTPQGNVISCSSTCRLEIVNNLAPDFLNCDQGGCAMKAFFFDLTLTEANGSKKQPVLFAGRFDIGLKDMIVAKVKADFSESCQLFQESEQSQ